MLWLLACKIVTYCGLGLTAVSLAWCQPRIILEAEDFEVDGAWEARPWEAGYFCATFANCFTSHRGFLRAPAQCDPSVASADFEVPEDGDYTLFCRYACPLMHNVAFQVTIEQNGTQVHRQTSGRIQIPKIWPFGGGIQPMPEYDWGGGDNMVWEQGTAPVYLRAGRARVTLAAGPQPEPAAERQVDVLLLTPVDDEEVARRLRGWSYLPLDGLLTQAGHLFMRVGNPEGGQAPLVAALTTTEHSPYWVHGRDWQSPILIGAQGRVLGELTAEQYLQPGQWSPWVEIGGRLDRLNESTLLVQVRYGQTGVEGTDVLLEWAVPERDGDMRTVRSLRYTDPTTRLIRVAVPANVQQDTNIRTAEEELERLLSFVRSLPDRGRTPELIGIRGVFSSHFVGTDTSLRVRELAQELQRALVGDAGEKGLQVTSLGDEIGLSLAKKTPEMDQAFRQYLRDRGLTPEELLPEEMITAARAEGKDDLWSLVELDYQGRSNNPRIWYHSQVFGYEHGSMAELKTETQRITQESGGEMYTGANYSPHPHYWPREYQWVRPFKLGALTMPWSEDYVWGIPELSPQVTGYLLDVFRCAAKYHDLPICYYVMPHSPGNTPRSFRLSYYAALAHGAKLIDHFCVTPIVTAYTENYVYAEALPMYAEVHKLARELGQFEDILYYGKVRQAQVAMLISGVTDLWNPSVNYNHERKCLYYALRHAGIPVDFLTEDDIVEGRLADYRVLYISASHMLSAAVEPLENWVSQGGIVCSVAGGGLLNEYNEPNPRMAALLGGQTATLQERDALVDTKHTLPRLRPLSAVRCQLPQQEAVAWPAIGTLQRLTPTPDAQVVGWFHDNGPAAVLRSQGAGQVLFIGAFPGAAYVVPAIPVRPWDRGTTDAAMCHFLPTEFDRRVQEIILWPVRAAGVEPGVRLSHPIVEWSAVDSDRGTAIVLINWTGEPIDELTVSVHGELGDRVVESVEHGTLRPTPTEDGWSVRLPLGITDCITVRERG